MVVTKSLPLDSDHFNYDLTEGFEMAVEKDWNVLDIATINKDFPIYDADLRPHLPTKYAVRLFYKACIPMNYVDPETYETNPLIKTANNNSFHGKYLDLVDGTVIGSPVDKMSQGSTTEQGYGEFGYHGLLIADDVPTTKEAYALPEYRDLNHTNIKLCDFATGSSIASCKVDTDYYQPKDVTKYTENVKIFAYMLMNNGGYNDGGVASFIVNNGALAYSIDTSGNRMNLPLDSDYEESNKYLQPLLFKPFGVAFADHLTVNNGTDVDTAGWFYCVLGVREITDEPTYDVTVEPANGMDVLYNHMVFSFQSNVSVIENSITGHLSYVTDFADSGRLAGSGNYLALHFSDIPEEADSVKAGLEPGYGAELVEILNSTNNTEVFKILSKNTQKFVVETSVNGQVYRKEFDISGLICEDAPTPPAETPFYSFTLFGITPETVYYQDGVTSYNAIIPGLISGAHEYEIDFYSDDAELVPLDIASSLDISIDGVSTQFTEYDTGKYQFNYTFDGINYPLLEVSFEVDDTTYTASYKLDLSSDVFDVVKVISTDVGGTDEVDINYVSQQTTYTGSMPTLYGTTLDIYFMQDNNNDVPVDVVGLEILVNGVSTAYRREYIGHYAVELESAESYTVVLDFDMGDTNPISYTITLS